MPPVDRDPNHRAPRNAAAKTAAKPEPSVLREPESVYLGRQPIIDRKGALHAYELLFRDSPDNRARIFDDVQATAHVVARTVGEIGLSAVLGDHRGYVNMNRDLLFDDIVHIMPPERFVLEILETVTFDAKLFKRCAQLRAAGFQFALDDVVSLTEPLHEALPYVDYVKVDFLATQRADLPGLAATLKQHGKTLIAEKIETHQDFEEASKPGESRKESGAPGEARFKRLTGPAAVATGSAASPNPGPGRRNGCPRPRDLERRLPEYRCFIQGQIPGYDRPCRYFLLRFRKDYHLCGRWSGHDQ